MFRVPVLGFRKFGVWGSGLRRPLVVERPSSLNIEMTEGRINTSPSLLIVLDILTEVHTGGI
jgi:hypothetical protein